MGDKLKIAYVIDDLSIGGAQKQLFLLTRILPERFPRVVCCLSEIKDPFGIKMEELGVRVYYFRRRSHLEAGRLAGLTRILKKERPRIIHSFLYASNAYAFLASKLLKIPAILSLRSDRLRLDPLRNRILVFMFKRADAVTVNSRAGFDFMVNEKHISRTKVHLVTNLYMHSGESPAPAPEKGDEKVIGYVGRIPPRGKNLENLIMAFAVLASGDSTYRLEIVGDGKGRKTLEELSTALSLGDKIKFHGAIWNVEAAMRNFTCLVLPSDFEGFPNSIIEALSLGIPVVASPVGDMPDILVEGKTGRFISDGSVQTLSRILDEVLVDEELRSNARKFGPETIESVLSPENTLSTLVPLYERLSSKGGDR